jgi:3-isopropylmalate/(R)-2-methylmalate dehydratase small subunit
MRPFVRLAAVAAALPQDNIDTDRILAARFLKTITRTGLGTALFSAMRFDTNGREREDFVLNREPWRKAAILIVGENFGCGSSREHAPWALTDFGIYCIVAASFADIFYNNCFKNGILPITLAKPLIGQLMDDARDPRTAVLVVDLPSQTISRGAGATLPFDIDPDRKAALLLGRDEIARSMERLDAIEEWERHHRQMTEIPLDIARLPQSAE